MRWPLSRNDGPGSLEVEQPIVPSPADSPTGASRAQVAAIDCRRVGAWEPDEEAEQ